MAEESFLLVSLNDEKAKKLSQVISNDTCRKILDLLAGKKYTETELSKELNLPISTIHYNLQLLQNSGLVKAKEYHYSEKGREVNHYELINKLIIISPQNEKVSIADLLKKFIPVTVIAGAITIALEFLQKTKTTGFEGANLMVQTAAKSEVADATAPVLAPRAMQMTAEKAPEIASQNPHYGFYFLAGALIVILVMILFELIRRKKKK
jgi:predicted transcriptional regulator